MTEPNNGGVIYLRDENEEIIQTFNNPQHLYDIMQSRYNALKNKRDKELMKAYRQGAGVGWLIGFSPMIIGGILWLIKQI